MVDSLPELRDQVVDQTAQELGLVVEVVVHESGRNAGFQRDRGDGRASIAMVGQHARECGQDFGALLLAITGSAHTLVG